MNTERFFAANAIALVTHTIVSITLVFISYRPNHLTSSKLDPKSFKKEKVTLDLDSKEVSTEPRCLMRHSELEEDLESSFPSLMLSQ
jgi:hypothetical protein